MAPNHFQIVEDVYATGRYEFWTKAGCGDFTEDAIFRLHAVDPNWGHLIKPPGRNQWYGHAVDAGLYLSGTPGQSQAVDFISASEAPIGQVGWSEDIPRYSPSDWLAPASGATRFVPPHNTRLGASCFPAMGMWRLGGTYADRLTTNLNWYVNQCGCDFVRCLGAMKTAEFRSNIDGQFYAPWSIVGSDPRWPDYIECIRSTTLRHADDFDLKTQWTFTGDATLGNAIPALLQLVDNFAAALESVIDLVECVEMINEYNVNGFTAEQGRAMAARWRQLMGDAVPIAISSPGTIHGSPTPEAVAEEMKILYTGDPARGIPPSAATLVTAHWSRAREGGPQPGYYLWPGAVQSNEPYGPGSSNTATDDPLIIGNYYRSSIHAGERAYVFHPACGIYMGELYGNFGLPQFPTYESHPTHEAIADQLYRIKQGNQAIPIPPFAGSGGSGGEGEPEMPLPPYDEPWLQQVVRPAVLERYNRANHPLDDLYPTWLLRTLYDHCAGMSKDASLDKHLRELESALGLA